MLVEGSGLSIFVSVPRVGPPSQSSLAMIHDLQWDGVVIRATMMNPFVLLRAHLQVRGRRARYRLLALILTLGMPDLAFSSSVWRLGFRRHVISALTHHDTRERHTEH